jgi:hypothetical protein
LKPGRDFAEVAAITQQNPGGLALVTLAHNTFTKSARVKDHRGGDLISDALTFGRLWYGEPNAISNAIDYAKFL